MDKKAYGTFRRIKRTSVLGACFCAALSLFACTGQPPENAETVYTEDLSVCPAWLNRTAAQAGLPQMEDDGNREWLPVRGKLFGADADGQIYFAAAEEEDGNAEQADALVVEKITLSCEALTYDACAAHLTALYGEPMEQGQEPYVEVDGGSVTWSRYDAGTGIVGLSAASKRKYISLEITRKSPSQIIDAALVSCTYSRDGSMEGGHWSVRASLEEDGAAKLVIESKDYYNALGVVTTYTIDAECLTRLGKVIDWYDLRKASEKQDSGLYALDGDSGALWFSYDNAASFQLWDAQELDAREFEGYYKIRDLLYSFAEGTPVSVITETHRIALSLPDGYTLFFTLNDSGAAEQLAEIIGTQQIQSYGNNEKIFYPDETLDVSDGVPALSGEAGTLAYYAPWGDVVIFYKEYAPADGLYELGWLDDADDDTLRLLEEMEDGRYSFYLDR